MYIITGSDCLSTICYFLKDKQQSTVPHFFPHYWKGGGKLFHELASPACSELQLSQQFRDSYKPHHYFVSTVHIVKAMVFPVVMYGCESWTIKKAERQRIDAFEPWCWRKLLRVPWTAKSNQSILEEINSEYSLDD